MQVHKDARGFLEMRGMPVARVKRRSTAIGCSFDVYYRDAARTRRMDRLNAAFASSGDVVFDIGAHVGDRTASFLRTGAFVVSLEPQPLVFRALRLIHGRNASVSLYRAAADARPGEIDLHVNSANPAVSTVSRAFMAAAAGSAGWQGQAWDDKIRVTATTLDQLMARHGRPQFVKIDVEGHELEVLKGLTVPVPALSFEFTTIQRAVAYNCIGRLGELGRYEFNLSFGEDHQLAHRFWIGPSEILAELAGLPETANSGDVYARLT